MLQKTTNISNTCTKQLDTSNKCAKQLDTKDTNLTQQTLNALNKLTQKWTHHESDVYFY